MKVSEHRFSWEGEEIRVIVAGDVLALPAERWSLGGFGCTIDVPWLLHEGGLPGRKGSERRRVLARCLVQALHAHHGVTL